MVADGGKQIPPHRKGLSFQPLGERERRLRAAEEALARQTAAPPSPAARLSRLLSHMRATLSRCIPLPRPRL